MKKILLFAGILLPLSANADVTVNTYVAAKCKSTSNDIAKKLCNGTYTSCSSSGADVLKGTKNSKYETCGVIYNDGQKDKNVICIDKDSDAKGYDTAICNWMKSGCHANYKGEAVKGSSFTGPAKGYDFNVTLYPEQLKCCRSSDCTGDSVTTLNGVTGVTYTYTKSCSTSGTCSGINHRITCSKGYYSSKGKSYVSVDPKLNPRNYASQLGCVSCTESTGTSDSTTDGMGKTSISDCSAGTKKTTTTTTDTKSDSTTPSDTVSAYVAAKCGNTTNENAQKLCTGSYVNYCLSSTSNILKDTTNSKYNVCGVIYNDGQKDKNVLCINTKDDAKDHKTTICDWMQYGCHANYKGEVKGSSFTGPAKGYDFNVTLYPKQLKCCRSSDCTGDSVTTFSDMPSITYAQPKTCGTDGTCSTTDTGHYITCSRGYYSSVGKSSVSVDPKVNPRNYASQLSCVSCADSTGLADATTNDMGKTSPDACYSPSAQKPSSTDTSSTGNNQTDTNSTSDDQTDTSSTSDNQTDTSSSEGEVTTVVSVKKDTIRKCWQCATTNTFKQCILMFEEPDKLPSDATHNEIKGKCNIKD